MFAAWLILSREAAAPREVRLSLLPPPNHEFAGNVANFWTDFGVSPDGTQIAFVATDTTGVQQLWVRALASTTARPLAGTTGAERPFWSPDSRFIGYTADPGICRVPAAGGTPQVIVPTGGINLDSKASWGAGQVFFERGEMIGGATQRSISLCPRRAVPPLPFHAASTRPTRWANGTLTFFPMAGTSST